ncbi:hypothetical protein [Xenorhabdus sp. PB30.3]|uniref:hypothetical protein n=1 Tax=Xenorhabdus sp. PB30.3 TaxID=2788941 RepID=UPI001E3294C1|nr:hypothetical protein [Xenorhabdus sp. PB30.3]MCC8381350.1 hypothetical protein [Xenorhabdus sp. PB30.3]
MEMQLDTTEFISVKWIIDKWVCETPQYNNNPETGGKYFIHYSVYLTGKDGGPAENSVIQIYSSIRSQILDDVIITTDPDDDSYPSVLNPVGDFIDIASDGNGKFNFRVYPMENTPLILQIGFKLPYTQVYYPGENVYIITPKSQNIDNFLSPPTISNIVDGKLMATGSEQTFNAGINSYGLHSSTDIIIFFTDKSGHISPAYNVGEEPGFFSLYYDDFLPLDSESNLYYVIIKSSGESQYSSVLPIVYGGGGDNRPSPDFSRSLASPIIYDSYAVPPFGSNDDVSIINSGDIVNINSIYNHSNNGGTALFVKIVGTNDVSNSSKPQFGDEVVLIIYVNSFSKTIHAKFPAEMVSFTPNNDNKRESTTIIKIPYEMLVDIEPYPESKEPPLIYFEYYVDTQGIRAYSQYWEAKISTVAPQSKY